MSSIVVSIHGNLQTVYKGTVFSTDRGKWRISTVEWPILLKSEDSMGDEEEFTDRQTFEDWLNRHNAEVID